MRLRAGLIRASPLWGSILDQEGFPWRVIRSPDRVEVDRYSVIIAGNVRGSKWEEVLERYVRTGGAAIVGQDILAGWIEGRRRWERFRYLLPAEDSRFRGIDLIEVPGRGLALEEGGTLRTDRGGEVLPIRPFGGGFVSSFPFDIARCMGDTRSVRRLFPSPVTPYPSERVSRAPKGHLRRMVRGVLEALHHLRGLHYAHLWYFPEEASSLFGLRVDTDYSDRREVQDLYSMLAERRVSASWYLHVKAHLGWIRDFAGMNGQEIGVHCYAHQAYGSCGLRAPDIAKATDLLRAVGLEPEGFSAPYGIWKEDLPVDLEKVGFRYSSEFGYDYDNLPSFPWVYGGFSNVLQVPVHPISIGSLARVGYRHREMIEYYTAVVERKLSVNEPIFLYVHPGDDHAAVLRETLDRVEEARVRKITFREYADAWRRRQAFLREIDLALDGDTITCGSRADGRVDRFRLSITDPAGNRCHCRPGKRLELKQMTWERRPEPRFHAPDPESLLGERRRRILEDLRTYFWRRRG